MVMWLELQLQLSLKVIHQCHNFKISVFLQSLYRHMGYTRRVGTTTRPPIPQGLYDESRRDYLASIDMKIKRYNIPPSLVLNSDQTPCSYVSVGKSTMAAQGTSSVPITGLTDKRSITLNFVIMISCPCK